jgi:hypothetical protein
MRAMLYLRRALRHLHRKSHAGRVSALLAIGARRQFENIKSFQSHFSAPPLH